MSNLIHFGAYVHRHLDWRSPLDWIGTPPYEGLEINNRLISILACAPDIPGVSWIRAFACEMQNYQEGVAYLEKASRGMPGNARIHYNLGLLYAFMQNPAGAESELQAALTLEPRNLDFQYGLADFYLKRGQFEQARKMAEVMASMHPENPIGRQMLDFIRTNTGR